MRHDTSPQVCRSASRGWRTTGLASVTTFDPYPARRRSDGRGCRNPSGGRNASITSERSARESGIRQPGSSLNSAFKTASVAARPPSCRARIRKRPRCAKGSNASTSCSADPHPARMPSRMRRTTTLRSDRCDRPGIRARGGCCRITGQPPRRSRGCRRRTAASELTRDLRQDRPGQAQTAREGRSDQIRRPRRPAGARRQAAAARRRRPRPR